MAFTIDVDIVSQEAKLFSGKGELIAVPGLMGELGITFGHAQLLTALKPGPVRIVNGDVQEIYYVSGGFAEIQPFKVTVLADVVERAADLDESLAIAAKQHAEQLLKDKKADANYAEVLAELAEATARLEVIRRLKRQK
jgi:F-type H+-transporting ATPase subunit epsilon